MGRLVPRTFATPSPSSTVSGRESPKPARERFLIADRYRVEREWKRYEGTPQRELFLALRLRFLARNFGPGPWALDLGSGPGRFTGALGPPGARRVALDLSAEMLRFVHPGPDSALRLVERVRADAASPPFRSHAFGTVAVLGNTLGFAAASSDRLLNAAERMVAPSGMLLLEVAPGPGERSRYLKRLPESALPRLLRSPVRAVIPRIAREGFARELARRKHPGDFLRVDPAALVDRFQRRGWLVREVMAVAPSLGPDGARIAAVRADSKGWAHLLELEEELGRDPARLTHAAAVLFAAVSSSAESKL